MLILLTGWDAGTPCFIVLHFIALRSCRCFLFYKLKMCGNPTYVKQVFSQQYLLTLCLCHILGILTIFLTFSLFCICHGDMCSLPLVLQKNHNSWNTQMMVTAFFFFFLAIKYFYFWPPWLVGFYFPYQDWTPGLLQWKLGVLTTGPPGNSPAIKYFKLRHIQSLFRHNAITHLIDYRIVQTNFYGYCSCCC